MRTIGFLVLVTMAAWGATQAGAASILEVVPDSGMVSNGKPTVSKGAQTDVDGSDLAVDELLKIASFEEESLRLAAVKVMGEYATPRARAALGITLYGNSMGTVRAAAAEELANYGDGETVFTLALALETERDQEVWEVIAANLERNLTVEPTRPGVEVAATR